MRQMMLYVHEHAIQLVWGEGGKEDILELWIKVIKKTDIWNHSVQLLFGSKKIFSFFCEEGDLEKFE